MPLAGQHDFRLRLRLRLRRCRRSCRDWNPAVHRYVDARTATFPGNENDLLVLIGNLVGHRFLAP